MYFIAFGIAIAIFAFVVGLTIFITSSLFIGKVVGVILMLGVPAAILGLVIDAAQNGDSKERTEKESEDIGPIDDETIAAETSDPDDDIVDFSLHPTPSDARHP